MEKILTLFCLILLGFIPRIALGQEQPGGGEEWYLRTQDQSAELYIYEIGKGNPVVVLHGGFGAEHSYLIDAVQGLKNDFRFILYDQRGSLRSPTNIENVSVDKHIDDLESLRKELGLEKIKIFAHSMGTLLAMHYLDRYPDRVEEIALVATLYPKSTKIFDSTEQALDAESKKAFLEFVRRPKVQELYKKYGANRKTRTAKEETALFKISFAAGNIYHAERWRQMKGGKVFWNQDSARASSKSLASDYDFIQTLAKHGHRITVINGDHDQTDFGNRLWKMIEPNLKGVKLKIIKNAGHNIWIDEPGSFKIELKRALAGR